MKLLCFCCVWWMASGASCMWAADAVGQFRKCQTPPEYTYFTSADGVVDNTCQEVPMKPSATFTSTDEADCIANSKCEPCSFSVPEVGQLTLCGPEALCTYANSAAFADFQACKDHSQSACVTDTKCGWVAGKVGGAGCIIKADADAYDATGETEIKAAEDACHDADANQAACEAVQYTGSMDPWRPPHRTTTTAAPTKETETTTTTAAPTKETTNNNSSKTSSSVRVADVMVSSSVLAGAVAVQMM